MSAAAESPESANENALQGNDRSGSNHPSAVWRVHAHNFICVSSEAEAMKQEPAKKRGRQKAEEQPSKAFTHDTRQS